MRLASRDAFTRAEVAYGPEGTLLIQSMIRQIRELYRHIAPDRASGGITVIRSATRADPASLATVGQLEDVRALAELDAKFQQGMTLVIQSRERLRASTAVLAREDCEDCDLVYRFQPYAEEYFAIDGERIEVEQIEDFVSPFATPTFVDLEEALDDYAANIARHGELHGLRDLWRDNDRLMFLPKPERGLRRSLEGFLDATLRATKGVELRPEQNVDESKPVDIKVIFSHSNRRAYIEIKWMGDSAPKPPGRRPHAKYRASRAQEGLRQLADYLDRDSARSLQKQVIGYLVVFDARRRRLKLETKGIDAKGGMHYAEQEVEYDSKLLARTDLAPPRRMFVEPLCRG